MRVVLLAEVKALGRAGEIKEVSDGYARNFLLPKKLAAPATPQAVSAVARKKAEAEAALAREREDERRLMAHWDGRTVEIGAKGREGRLFGSITARDIAAALATSGSQVTGDMVRLEKPIKETGIFTVTLRSRHGSEARLIVAVRAV